MEYTLTTPIPRDVLAGLRAGDTVRLSGVVYTARDAAHKKMAEMLEQAGPGAAVEDVLPFDIRDAVIYYAGPTPAPPGAVIGAVGPTTAGRMDSFAPGLLRHGLAAMVGKGARSAQVLQALRETGTVYFGALGGAGALAAACIKSCQVIAFAQLGSEAVRRLEVEDFPLTVLADSVGGDLYQSGPGAYRAQAGLPEAETC